MLLQRIKRLALLSVILAIGFASRAYQLNFPSIGYHNMKENEYLSMAQVMRDSGDYLTRRIYFYDAFEKNPLMVMYPQPPLVSYQALLVWNIFGENLWSVRLSNVLFGLGSILLLYLLALYLFNSLRAAFGSAFLLAIMPLAVFFSRNIQPESPAFFFMLLGSFFYVRFGFRRKALDAVLGGLAFCAAWAYKFTFLVGILPFIFCLPWRSILKDKLRLGKDTLFLLLPYLLLPLAFLWLKAIGQWQFESENTLSRINPQAIFSAQYWKTYGETIWLYISKENFTEIFTWLALAGLVLALIKRKSFLHRYLIGWLLAIFAYAVVFSDFLNQHNYYQMPFLLPVCLAVISALLGLGSLGKFYFRKDVFIPLIIVAVLAAAPSAWQSFVRYHSVVFLGVDVAGASLKKFTKPDERVFLYAHMQAWGIGRYARRFMGWPKDLNEFKQRENEFNMRYVCIYPVDLVHKLKQQEPEIYEYLRANYHIKEAGAVVELKRLYYLILEKGPSKDPDKFLENLSGPTELRTIYNILNNYYFFSTITPQENAAK